MSVMNGCHDARYMKSFEEIDCPSCHEQGGIEVIIQDGKAFGENTCIKCGYSVPEGTPAAELDSL